MLSLFDIKRLLSPGRDDTPVDDFRIIQSWAEYDDSSSKDPELRNLEYLCYELETMNPATGERTHFYKAIRLARVERLPANAKQSTSFMDMQQGILAGVYETGINLITIIANVIKPVALGLLYLYGVQGVSEDLDDAKQRAHEDFLRFIGMMQGTFRVLEMRCADAQESEWLREKMYNMDYLTVVRGIPKANKAGENAGNKGMGNMNLNPDAQGTLEEMIIGMADYEYVIEILSTPVYTNTLMGWQRSTQKEMTAWYGQLQGQKSLSMNLSIPMMYMANAGQAQGWSKAYTDADTVSYAQGESFTTTEGQSVGQSITDTYGRSVGHSEGTSYSQSVSNGVSASEGVSFGESFGLNQNVSVGHSEGESSGINAGISANESHGSSQGVNFSENQGLSQNVGFSQGHTQSVGNSYSVNASESVSQNHNVSQGQSMGYSMGENYSQGNSASISHGTTRGESNSMSESYGNSASHGTSQNSSFSENHGNSSSTSGSIGANIGGSFGLSGTNLNGSISGNKGFSYGDSYGYGESQSSGVSDSAGWSHSNSASHSSSASESNTATQGASSSYGQSFSQNQGYSASESYGVGQSQSLGQSWGANVSDSESVSMSNSVGNSYSVGKGVSQGLSESYGTGYSAGQSYGLNESDSVSRGTGQSFSQNTGQNKSVSQSRTLGESLGQNQSVSESQSVSKGFGTNTSRSNSVSQGNSYTTSNGNSRGTSQGSTGTLSTGTSASMGLGPSIGYSKSYQWMDQGVKDLLELLEYQNERIKKALRGEGAFYTYVYIGCPNLDALSTAQAVAKSTWQNEYAMVQPLQVLDLTETEQKHLLYHFAAFSADITRENVFGAEEYKYCTVLLPEEYVAYTHLPRISEGGVWTTPQDIPKFATPSMLKGEIYMGTILNAERYTFNNGYRTQMDYRIDESMLMHGYFTGASRSGKTVAAMRFVAELSRVRRKKTGKRLRIVAMDPKQDWRTLARFVEPERFNFYSMGNPNFHPIKLNPWKVPRGVYPQIWIDGVIDIYCRAYGLLERGKQMIADVVYALYEENGVFDACREDNWKELVPELSKNVNFAKIYQRFEFEKANLENPKNPKGRAGNDTRDAYARLLERLSCFGRDYSIECQLYGTSDGLGIDDIIGGDDVTILESKGLENTFKNFIFGVVTSGFYKYAYSHDGGFLAEDQYETVLVIEEANEILTGNDTAGTGGKGSISLSGQSEFEQILDQSAGYGLFIMAITQKIADMPSSIIANSGLVFAGKLKRPEDINVIVRAVGREERIDDRDYVKWFPRAGIGQFVCQASRAYNFKDAEPVLVQISRLNINPPSNQELDEILLEKEISATLAGGEGALAA